MGPSISCTFGDISILPLPGLLPRCQVGMRGLYLGSYQRSEEETDRYSEDRPSRQGMGGWLRAPVTLRLPWASARNPRAS